jgi:hypothetical protein
VAIYSPHVALPDGAAKREKQAAAMTACWCRVERSQQLPRGSIVVCFIPGRLASSRHITASGRTPAIRHRAQPMQPGLSEHEACKLASSFRSRVSTVPNFQHLQIGPLISRS